MSASDEALFQADCILFSYQVINPRISNFALLFEDGIHDQNLQIDPGTSGAVKGKGFQLDAAIQCMSKLILIFQLCSNVCVLPRVTSNPRWPYC